MRSVRRRHAQAEQLALFGILRDPPPGASVNPATLNASLLAGIHGIRTNYIRLLPPAPGFPHQLLYTVTSGEFGPAQFNPAVGAPTPTEAKNLICVESLNTDGGGGDCTDTGVLTSGHWLESTGLDGYAGARRRRQRRPALRRPSRPNRDRDGEHFLVPRLPRTSRADDKQLGPAEPWSHSGVPGQHHMAGLPGRRVSSHTFPNVVSTQPLILLCVERLVLRSVRIESRI